MEYIGYHAFPVTANVLKTNKNNQGIDSPSWTSWGQILALPPIHHVTLRKILDFFTSVTPPVKCKQEPASGSFKIEAHRIKIKEGIWEKGQNQK